MKAFFRVSFVSKVALPVAIVEAEREIPRLDLIERAAESVDVALSEYSGSTICIVDAQGNVIDPAPTFGVDYLRPLRLATVRYMLRSCLRADSGVSDEDRRETTAAKRRIREAISSDRGVDSLLWSALPNDGRLTISLTPDYTPGQEGKAEIAARLRWLAPLIRIQSDTRWIRSTHGRRAGVWHLGSYDKRQPLCGRVLKGDQVMAMVHAEPLHLGRVDTACERCRAAAVGTDLEVMRYDPDPPRHLVDALPRFRVISETPRSALVECRECEHALSVRLTYGVLVDSQREYVNRHECERNGEGLTWPEWRAAAGIASERTAKHGQRAAWYRGEDPCDHRAAFGVEGRVSP